MRSNALNAYAQNAARIESPEKLVQMLFEGVLRFTAQAKKSIEDGDIEKKVYLIHLLSFFTSSRNFSILS